MHELGIVFSIMDTLEECAQENSLAHIHKVNVSVGEVSGVLSEYFEDAWNWAAAKHSLTKGAKLSINVIPAVTVCNDCGRTYATVEFGRSCPYCKSSHTELLRGNELEIDSIEAE